VDSYTKLLERLSIPRGGSNSYFLLVSFAQQETYKDTEILRLSSMYCFVFSLRGEDSKFSHPEEQYGTVHTYWPTFLAVHGTVSILYLVQWNVWLLGKLKIFNAKGGE
jgi:hypothetical protein